MKQSTPKNIFPKNLISKNLISRNLFSRNLFSRNLFSKKLFSKKLFSIKLILCLLFPLLGYSVQIYAQKEKPKDYLSPVNTESPRACLRSFMDAMNAYRSLSLQDASEAEPKIKRALQTLNLEDTSTLLQEQKGKQAAIYLKEIIDRIVVLDYSQIPDKNFDSNPQGRWRVAGTEILIQRAKTGERAGEYLFSKQTVKKSYKFFQKVKHLPYLSGSGQGSGYQTPWFEKNLPEWVRKPFLTLDWWQWGGLFLAILAGLALRVFFRFGLLIFLRILPKPKKSQLNVREFFHDVLTPLSYLVAILFWFLALFGLQLQGTAFTLVNMFLKFFISACLIWLAYRTVGHFSEHFKRIAFRSQSKLDDQLAPLLSRSLKLLTLIAGILLAVQNLGINVASVLTGLGLGGLAFALAARDTVANLFGSLMIIVDRPFQIGDWVKIKGAEGHVEDIGFRSTRIRTFYNSLISIPNSEVAGTQIDNMGARQYRRVKAHLSITYDTPPSKVEAFLEGIKNIIKASSFTRKDHYHVVFEEYGNSGLIIMAYFYLVVRDWAEELVERQNIYLQIYSLAKDLNIEFAFPTQTLHIESFPEKEPRQSPSAHNQSTEELRKTAKEYEKDGPRSLPKGMGIFTPLFREKK